MRISSPLWSHTLETSKTLEFEPSPGCFTRIGQQLYDNESINLLDSTQDKGTNSSLKQEDACRRLTLTNSNEEEEEDMGKRN